MSLIVFFFSIFYTSHDRWRKTRTHGVYSTIIIRTRLLYRGTWLMINEKDYENLFGESENSVWSSKL